MAPISVSPGITVLGTITCNHFCSSVYKPPHGQWKFVSFSAEDTADDVAVGDWGSRGPGGFGDFGGRWMWKCWGSAAASRAAFLMASRAKWVRCEWVIKTVRLFACPVMKDCK